MKTISKNSLETIKDFYNRPSNYWQEQQEAMSLKLFHKMAKGIYAYKQFLLKNSVKAKDIKSFTDFENLPAINKKNYFNKFSLDQTAWPKAYKTQGLVMTSTSGSTGQPTYFPRSELLDWQYSVWAEMFLKNGKKGNSLLIDCFGMGVWIGGLITYQAFRNCALRGYPVTIITPGINKKEIFHALKELAPSFQNVIIAGYPPFIKDLIDETDYEKINLKKLPIRLIFAAEGFNEHLREYFSEKTGIDNFFLNTMNIYGSAELGAMAVETPFSILVRRLAIKNEKIYDQIFKQKKLPTLAQFNPNFVNFQEKNGQILITANSICPVINYQIGDTGTVYNYEVINRIFNSAGINLRQEAKKMKIQLCQLPLVAVYERSDFSTKLYGAIIYPEHIREGLQNKKLEKFLSGKFVMSTKTDKNHNQYLEINIEMKKGQKITPQLEKLSQHSILKILLEKNAEYKNNFDLMSNKVLPKVILLENGNPNYFLTGLKQRWVK